MGPTNKCHFFVIKGKPLGHIVSKDGVRICPERVATIDKIQVPKTLNEIQLLFEQINFWEDLLQIFRASEVNF